MTNKNKHSLLLVISIFCSIISSLSILASIFVNSDGENQIILITFGLVFWVGFAFEQILLWKANRLLIELIKKEKMQLKGKCGLLTIASSVEALIVDVLFVISLIAFVICFMFNFGVALLQYIFICLIILSFRLHCILNGKNYRYKKIFIRKEKF